MKIAVCFYGLAGSTNLKYGIGKPLNQKFVQNYIRKYFSFNPKMDVYSFPILWV